MVNSSTNKTLFFLLFTIFSLLAACRPTRNLVYFSDLKENDSYRTKVNKETALQIQPDDLLAIRISSLNAESNALFCKRQQLLHQPPPLNKPWQ
jgi:hypothetical protein